jgi:ribosomal protein L37AE/L43A
MLFLMDNSNFRCKYCNYLPRANEKPFTGVWYCPKCGKRTRLEQTQKIQHKFIQRKDTSRRITRDRASSQIYSQHTREKNLDYGLKTPYLSPSIKEIKPKTRKEIPVFFQSKKNKK